MCVEYIYSFKNIRSYGVTSIPVLPQDNGHLVTETDRSKSCSIGLQSNRRKNEALKSSKLFDQNFNTFYQAYVILMRCIVEIIDNCLVGFAIDLMGQPYIKVLKA